MTDEIGDDRGEDAGPTGRRDLRIAAEVTAKQNREGGEARYCTIEPEALLVLLDRESALLAAAGTDDAARARAIAWRLAEKLLEKGEVPKGGFYLLARHEFSPQVWIDWAAERLFSERTGDMVPLRCGCCEAPAVRFSPGRGFEVCLEHLFPGE